MFARFEREPVASASVAQVHFAELPDGREVAVKILRPASAGHPDMTSPARRRRRLLERSGPTGAGSKPRSKW